MNMMKIGGAALLAAVGITIGTGLLDAIDSDRARKIQAHQEECAAELNEGVFSSSKHGRLGALAPSSANRKRACADFAMNSRQIIQ
jgi:hypothetical protein